MTEVTTKTSTEIITEMTATEPRTLHWYFSIGTSNREAHYYLDESLTARFEGHDAFDLSRVETPSAYISTAKSATAGILQLLCGLSKSTEPLEVEGLGVNGATTESTQWQIRLRCIETEAVRDVIRGSTKTHMDVLRGELPFDSRHVKLRREDLDEPALLVQDFNPRGMEKIIAWLLNEEADLFREGDAVFFESTSGLRPIQMGFTLSAELLRVLRPEIDLIGMSYAELGKTAISEHIHALDLREVNGASWSPPPLSLEDQRGHQVKLSPCYDLSELFALPEWASALKALRERFDARWLAHIIDRSVDHDGELHALKESLDQLSLTFGLGLADHMVTPLQRVSELLERSPASLELGSAWRAIKPTLMQLTGDLISDTVAEGNFDHEMLSFHLRVSDALIEAGRLGDAVRVLRELVVSRMLLAQHPEGGVSVNTKTERKIAEEALFKLPNGELKEVWGLLGELRNSLSHGDQGRSSDDERDLFKELNDALSDDPSSLLSRLKTLLSEDEAWVAPVIDSSTVVWLYKPGHDVDDHVSDEVARGWAGVLDSYAGKKLRYPSKKTKLLGLAYAHLWLEREPDHGPDLPSIRRFEKLKVKSREGQEKKLKAALSGACHLILRERELSLPLTVHIIRIAEQYQTFCWQWTPPADDAPLDQRFGQLNPLFTTGDVKSALRN